MDSKSTVSQARSQTHRPVAERRPRPGKILTITLVVLAVVAGGAYSYYRFVGFESSSSLNQPLTAEVTRGPFDHIVLEQGEVESSSNVEVVCQVEARGSGGTPILWVIDEGTYVKEGDKLVELDASALQQELKTQRIAVSSARALVISSEAAVRTAEIALEEYLKGTYLSERKTILGEIAVAEQELRKAELNLESARRLAAKGMLKGLQIEAEEFAVSNAENVLDSAKTRLWVLDELSKEKNAVQFESDIEAAKAQLDSDRSVQEEEQEKLAELEQQVANCVMYSPTEGVVVHANDYSRRGDADFIVEEGANVRERQTIIKLPDPNRMQVKAQINESRITLVGEGMPAKIRVGSAASDLTGRVKRVNKYAEPGSWYSSSVKEYATFIEILDPPPTIRTGMTAEVRIFVEQLEDALQIPIHGIYEYKGLYLCLVKTNDGWDTRRVEIGATNDKMVTIESGLEEGETVGLNPRKFLHLMELPEVDEVSDREELARIGADAREPEMPLDAGDDDRAGGPQGQGEQRGEGGRPGPGSRPNRGNGGPGASNDSGAQDDNRAADGGSQEDEQQAAAKETDEDQSESQDALAS